MSSNNQDLLSTLDKNVAEATEMYLRLNQELADRLDSLTSSKLKSLMKRVSIYPLILGEDNKASTEENEAFEIAAKIKEIYVDLFIMTAQLKEQTKELENGKAKENV